MIADLDVLVVHQLEVERPDLVVPRHEKRQHNRDPHHYGVDGD